MTTNTPDCCPNGNIGPHEKTHAIRFGITFILLLGITGLATYFIPIMQNLAPYVIYLAISTIALTFTLIYFNTHSGNVTSMTGMMIGMTIGMQAGFLLGGTFALINGYFLGTITGMTLGCLAGAYAGKRAGVMAVMEGLMAGAMGGSMGAMLTIMMPVDKIHYFMPYFLTVNLIIMTGLCYLICRYCGENEKIKHSFTKTLLTTAILLAALITLAILLPKNIFLT